MADGLPPAAPDSAGMPPGAGGGGPPPALPKSPIGGPGGPGASPMLSPGGGAGARAEAVQKIKVAHTALLVASLAFEQGSKEQQALLRAVSALNVFGKAEGADMVPAGIAAMAQASKKGPPMAAPPPGVMGGAGGGPPPMPPPGAEA